jgi:hypothetical protein
MGAQTMLLDMIGRRNQLQSLMEFISKNRQLQEGDFRAVRRQLEEIHQTLNVKLKDAAGLLSPALTNVPAGSSLYSLIMDRGDTVLPALQSDSISGQWLGMLAARLEGVLRRIRRVHFKSLGSLLVCQERLTGEWVLARAQPPPLPGGADAPSPPAG